MKKIYKLQLFSLLLIILCIYILAQISCIYIPAQHFTIDNELINGDEVKISSTIPKHLREQHFTIDNELVNGDEVKISFTIPRHLREQQIELYRSSSNLTKIPIDMYRYPITKFTISNGELNNSFIDRFVAHNTTYYYVAKITGDNKLLISSNIDSVTIPNIMLPTLTKPNFIIDKVHYYIELKDNEQPIKRYPIALGKNPISCKLHQDRASTPEGIYKIINLQQRATYHRAYDINYPNRIDRIRYDFAKSQNLISSRGGVIPSIGGEIQIHGMGIGNNWTWGCVALRNEDIDELFNHKEIRSGTTVIIVGEEIMKKDIISILKERAKNEIREIQRRLSDQSYNVGKVDGVMGPQTRYAIGKFQMVNKLPITCDLDRRTIDKLMDS